jgi:mono/diheme cytochrome c family protein
MSQDKPRSSLFGYAAILIIAAVVVVVVFLRGYKMGADAGRNAPAPKEGTVSATGVNEQALAKDAGLAAKGKTLFMLNCASCHGPSGNGDGDKAASLNPKPRNYHTEKFKFGNDIVSIHNTILKGSAGTSMPSFALLPVEETWALAHYVLTQIPNAPAITDALVASLPTGAAGSSAPSSAAAALAAQPKIDSVRIPIQLAMQRMATPAAPPFGASHVNSSLPGAALYAAHCASCHGAFGEGKAVRVLAVAPYKYESSENLATSTAAWTKDRNKFADVVVKGLPGRIMPGMATLTSQQIDDLFVFVRSLQTP